MIRIESRGHLRTFLLGVVAVAGIVFSLVFNVQSVRAQDGDPETGVGDTPSFTWSVEYRVDIPKERLRSSSGKTDALDSFQRGVTSILTDKPEITYSTRLVAGEDGQEDLSLDVTGTGDLDSLRQVIYSDLKPVANIFANTVDLEFSLDSAGDQPVTLILESSPASGYIWETGDEAGGFEMTGEPQFEQKTGLLGAPARQIVQLQATGQGAASVTLKYRRPWESETGTANRISLHAQAATGSIDLSDPTPLEGAEAALTDVATVTESEPLSGAEGDLPTEFDWRLQTNLPDVRDQGYCGSCWAFATVGVMETAMVIQGGEAVTNLSEQYLLSCNRHSYDCNGGWFANDYHTSLKGSKQTDSGAVLEHDLPYKGVKTTCKRSYDHPYKLLTWQYLATSSSAPPDETIKQTVFDYGPVASTICAARGFYTYTGGIFSEDNNCVNHAVVIVGWNDADDTWTIRNSWGPNWGEHGYMRIKRGVSKIGYAANYVRYKSRPLPPANDDFDAAIVIDVPAETTYTDASREVTSASTMPDDPKFSRSLSRRYRSVWYRYTATDTGRLTVDTIGSTYNTVLGVWSGSRGALKSAGYNVDYDLPGGASRVQTLAITGVTYYVEVASYNSSGDASLTFNLQFAPLTPLESSLEPYDDLNDALVYSGNWAQQNNLAGSNDSTLHTSKLVGEQVAFSFRGYNLTLLYTRMRRGGNVDVSIDGRSAALLKQNSNKKLIQQQWHSGNLGSEGPHIVILTHTRGKTVNLDGFIVSDQPGAVPIDTGTLEESGVNFDYNGFWQTGTPQNGASGGTYAVSSIINDAMTISFQSNWIGFKYSRIRGGGWLEVWIDGALKASLPQSGSKRGVHQVNWVSDRLDDSIHSMTLIHRRGKTVNVDALLFGYETDIWQPTPETTWQIQFTGEPINTGHDVTMYELDMDVDPGVVETLNGARRNTVCYINAGAWENWRADRSRYPRSVIGRKYDGWAGEKWLDVRKISTLSPIIGARLDACKQNGFTGVEFDNVAGYLENTGFRIRYQDQLAYNIFLANMAHVRGLSVGLKNDLEQIVDLVDDFDWALNEECFEYGECDYMTPFIDANKAVFNIEYNLSTDDYCTDSLARNFSSLRKNLELDDYREDCSGYSAG